MGSRVATLGDRVDPIRDRIKVDGVPVPAHPDLRYLALNKPPGVTTTLRDKHAEHSVAELIPAGPRVFPVGRLDRDTEGLLLLTNDGDLSARIQHPRFGVEKEYLAEVEGEVSRRVLRALAAGVDLEDGRARALVAETAGRRRGSSAVTLVMVEGRKREVRRMLAAVGHPVVRLVRVRIGPVKLGRIEPGQVRPLEPREVTELYRLVGLGQAGPSTRLRGTGRKASP